MWQQTSEEKAKAFNGGSSDDFIIYIQNDVGAVAGEETRDKKWVVQIPPGTKTQEFKEAIHALNLFPTDLSCHRKVYEMWKAAREKSLPGDPS
jgi:hypothetical protein